MMEHAYTLADVLYISGTVFAVGIWAGAVLAAALIGEPVHTR